MIKNRYPGYTLLELLVVMSIFIILGAMTFAAFDGLQNTVKMNEYMLNLEQDIRNVQRSSMLLQRNPGEKWIYGLGIDFSDVQVAGQYSVFKWCSPFDDYGHISTKSIIPSYDPQYDIGATLEFGVNGTLPTTVRSTSICDSNVTDNRELKTLPGYDKTISIPKANVLLNDAQYILFESVSGRTFFYDANGALLNFNAQGEIVENPEPFSITVDPSGRGITRNLKVSHLSGKIQVYSEDEGGDSTPPPVTPI